MAVQPPRGVALPERDQRPRLARRRAVVLAAFAATSAASVGLAGVGISSSSAADRHTLSAATTAAGLAAGQQREASADVSALVAGRTEVLAARDAQRADIRHRVAAAKQAAAAKRAKQAAAAKRAKALADAQKNPKAVAKRLLDDYGFGADQWSCLSRLWVGESNWNYRAANSSSGAYGIPQALPGSKMGAVADDWKTNPTTQIRWGLKYIKDVYGSPCGAWGAWNARYPHWY
ncbi:MAG: hypothetical protein V9G19_22625 [Tetrasphaera sp.]